MKPTRVRFSIVLLAMAVNMLCYTDRVCISIAVPEIRKEFGLDSLQMGWVLSIFSLSYALAQAPWGAFADRYGARGLVAFAILAWSAFTVFTGYAWGLASLLAIRLVFGGLEAALSPATARGFTRWIPVRERSAAFGVYLGGGRFGGAITPGIAAWLMVTYGWRDMFLVFGALGLAASAAWYFWYRDDPQRHNAVNPAELETIRIGTTTVSAASEPVPWREILTNSRFWCLLGVAFLATFLWQFYITWFPTYLREQRGLPLSEAAKYASLPFLFGVAATWAGGFAADLLTRRLGVTGGRRLVGLISMTTASAMMLAGVLSPDPRTGAFLMAAAAFSLDLYLGAAWASAVDIGGTSGGAVAGLMNGASNAAGFASPVLMGWVLNHLHDWNLVLFIGIAATVAAAALWLGVQRGSNHPAPTR